MPFANLHVIAETFDAHCRVIAETCHPIDLATFLRRAARQAVRCPSGRCSSRSTTGIVACSSWPVRSCALPHSGRDVRLLRAGPPSASVLVRRRGARAGVRTPSKRSRDAGRSCGAAGRASTTRPPQRAPALAPMTESQVKQLADEGFAIGVHTASHAPLAQAPAEVQRRRARVVPLGARIVDRAADRSTVAYPFGAPGRLQRGNDRDCGEPWLHRRLHDAQRLRASDRAGARTIPLRGARRGHGGRTRASHRLRLAALSRHRPSMSTHPGSASCSRRTTASATSRNRSRACWHRRHADFELIICDDQSSDGTVGIIHDYARRDSRIRVLDQRAQPRRLSRTGVTSPASRRGPFLKYHDSDDVMYPTLSGDDDRAARRGAARGVRTVGRRAAGPAAAVRCC